MALKLYERGVRPIAAISQQRSAPQMHSHTPVLPRTLHAEVAAVGDRGPHPPTTCTALLTAQRRPEWHLLFSCQSSCRNLRSAATSTCHCEHTRDAGCTLLCWMDLSCVVVQRSCTAPYCPRHTQHPRGGTWHYNCGTTKLAAGSFEKPQSAAML